MAVFSIVAYIYGSVATCIVLFVLGNFLAFTYSGTKIDFDKRRVKAYTCLFGFISYGKWIRIDEFNKFTISKTRRSQTTYSRANVPLTLKSEDIRLKLLNNSGTNVITIGKYNSFNAARTAMTDLTRDLQIPEVSEVVK